MWKNNIKIAWRSLLRQKGYSLINVTGLAIAIAVSMLILLWVQDEYAMDKFHVNGDRLYLLKRSVPLEGKSVRVQGGVPYPLMKAAAEELPEVEKFIPLGYNPEETLILGETPYRAKGTYGNTAYFEAFSYPVILGDITQLDKKIEAIAISESLAKRFFGNTWETNALNQSITIYDSGDFTIEAVYQDFPQNSSDAHDFVYSFMHRLQEDWIHEWGNSGMGAALLLAAGSNPEEVGVKIDALFKTHQEGERKEGCFLQQYEQAYLYSTFDEQGKVAGGRIQHLRIFTIAALFLLLISCINFMNLATARASTRAKEVGVRKVVGAGKLALVRQFMTEAAMMTFLALILALGIVIGLLPNLESMTGKALNIELSDPVFWQGIIAVTGLTILCSGAYPAFVLASLRPKTILSGKQSGIAGNTVLRKALVVTQFVLALFLIVGAIVIQQQVNYVLEKNIGLNKDNLLYLTKDEAVSEKYDILKSELINQPGIAGITAAGPTPIDMQASTSGVNWEGKRAEQRNIEFQILWAESDVLDVFEIPLVEGRFYRKGTVQDTNSIVLNERAIAIMGLEDPIGKKIEWWGQNRQIIGVVKDFHNRSLYDEIEPLGILLSPDGAWSVFVRTKPNETTQAIASLQSTFKTVLPNTPLHFEFVDEQYQLNYDREMLTSSLARYFAFISIFISCLGLLGLITLAAVKKKKEIGIRKVLGASIASIVGLLSKEFLLLIGLAFFIALPITWTLLQLWLQNFAYHIAIEWWVFALAGIAAVIISLVTISIQSIKAAIANPVDSLRNE